MYTGVLQCRDLVRARGQQHIGGQAQNIAEDHFRCRDSLYRLGCTLKTRLNSMLGKLTEEWPALSILASSHLNNCNLSFFRVY